MCEPVFGFVYRCASETAFGSNCREVPGDRKLAYPDCCPRYECDDEDNNNTFEYGSNSLWNSQL